MLSIRKACIEDVPVLMELSSQLGYKIALATLTENVQAYSQDPDRSLLVTSLEGNVVGYIALDVTRTFHRDSNQMRVVSLVVDQMHRGKGIGKYLLQEAEEWARQKGCWVIELTSSTRRVAEGVHSFYATQGYLKNGSQAIFRKVINS